MTIIEKGSNEVILNNDRKNLQLKKEMIVEMARINMKESNIFPFNKFEVKIWSNDHTPPHFHIKSDGWNISYVIETGEQLEILEKGEKKSVYKYISNNVNKWLNNKCALIPQITNRENAMAQWIQLHSQDKTDESFDDIVYTKRQLYESILKDVAKIVKSAINKID